MRVNNTSTYPRMVRRLPSLIRPSISLKTNVRPMDGDGTARNPYIVE